MVNNLTIKNYNGVNVTDSREVAEMIGKNHAHLLRDIQGYIKVISQNPKLDSDKFFVESSYKSGTGKEYTCYLLTKQGCEMVANKMTGEKGILFTAEYVQAFNKMEEHIKQQKPQITNDVIINALKNILEEHEIMKKELKEKTALINKINNCISNASFPVKQKVELSENAFRGLIVEFMNENDVVIKSHKQGLAIDKDALYKYMAQYGWTQHDVLKTLDKYHMIYHSGEDKTQRLRLEGKTIRTLIIQ